MRVRRSRATSAGSSPRWTASYRADSVCERRSVGARSSCSAGTSTPALARWRTAPASTTNLVIGTTLLSADHCGSNLRCMAQLTIMRRMASTEGRRSQLLRGVLDLCLLAVVEEEPAYGYE